MSNHRPLAVALATAVALASAAPGLAAALERPVQREFPSAALHELELENLAGNVTLTGAAAGTIRVTATVFAEDSAGASAAALAESLRVEFDDSGGTLRVRAVYPLGEHRRYHYPRAQGDDSRSDWSFGWPASSSSMIEYQGERVRVVGSRGSDAATLYVDFAIELPAGVSVVAKNAVGTIASTGVTAGQTLDAAAGSIRVADGRGALVVDTGSGDIDVDRHAGDVLAETGSGDVTLRGVAGERLGVDTGSGDVVLDSCRGSLEADTGSGDVIARGFVAGRSFRADSGSGDVRAEGDFAAVRDLRIDTGSGDVTLAFAAPPSLRLTVATGSGEIDLDLEGATVRSASRDQLVARLGAGEGEGTIDTGSGDVRLSAAR